LIREKKEYLVTNLDYTAAIAVIELYTPMDDRKQMFEDVLMIWGIEQELKKE